MSFIPTGTSPSSTGFEHFNTPQSQAMQALVANADLSTQVHHHLQVEAQLEAQQQQQQLSAHPHSPWDQQDFSNAPSVYSASPIDQQHHFQLLQEAAHCAQQREQDEVQAQAHQQQQQQQLEEQRAREVESIQQPITSLSPTGTSPVPTPSTYDSPQVIELIERPLKRLRPPNSRAMSDVQKQKQRQLPQQTHAKTRAQTLSPSTQLRTPALTPVEPEDPNQQQQQQQLEKRGANSRPRVVSDGSSSIQWYELQDSKVPKIAKGQQKRGASDARAQARAAVHPYQRSTSKTESRHVMAGGHIPNPSSPGSSKMAIQRNGISTEKERVQPVKRYLLRADVHFSSRTNIITAMLELPGVKRSDVRIGVHVNTDTNEKQIVIRGRSRPLLPIHAPTSEDGAIECYFSQERKHGEFKRVLVVPQALQPEDVQANFEDGILFLRYPMDPKKNSDDGESEVESSSGKGF